MANSHPLTQIHGHSFQTFFQSLIERIFCCKTFTHIHPVKKPTVRSLVYLLYAIPAVQAALIPQLPVQTSSLSSDLLQPGLTSSGNVLNQVIPTPSGLLPSALSSSLPRVSSGLSPTPSILNELPSSSNILQLAPATVSSILNVNLPTSSGLLQPALNTVSSIINQALPTSFGLVQPASTSNSLPIPSALPQPALNSFFNGINVAFPASSASIPPILASVTSNANQILPTSSELLQAAVTGIKANINQALSISFVLPLPTATNVPSSAGLVLPASCIDVFSIASQASGSLASTLITLQAACSPLSVYVSNLQLSSDLGSASSRNSTMISLSNAVAAGPSRTEISALSFSLPTANSGSPLPPCTTMNLANPQASTCSLVLGSVVPLNGPLPCGTCPTNAGLLGVDHCPWLCSISFFEAGVYSCSPIDITGQTFPDSGALNITNHFAEAVCHQCAAPCNAVMSSVAAIAPTNRTASSASLIPTAASIPALDTSNATSCTNLPTSTSLPCCEPYGNRGNLVCNSCPVDPTELAVCPWLCRMPYIQGKIDLECSPVDLTGINLFSPYNETVQCERCLPACSSPGTLALASISSCALSTTVVAPLTPTGGLPLTVVTTVSVAAPTCTNIVPEAPSVTCKGGPDFSTLFCPQGCPTILTDQCSFLCISTFGSFFGGLFPAIQCAPVDLSLISPGVVSCQQCFPQCNSSSGGPLSGASAATNASTVTLAATSTTAPSATCTAVSPTVVDSPASQDNSTGLHFRSSCGSSAATVVQRPYLCSQGGGAVFQECSNTDLSEEEPTGQFPPIVCTHCLPPCSNLSAPSTANSSASVQTFPISLAAALSGANSVNLNGSAFFSSLTSALALSTPITSAARSSSLITAFANLSSSATSAAASQTADSMVTGSTSSSSISPSPNSSSPTSLSTASCTSVIPFGTDTPAIVVPNTGLLLRSSCGFTQETVAQCPFICSAGGGAPNENCSSEDMTGRLMFGSYPPIICQQCLPPCEGATTTSAAATCSSVAANAPNPSPLIDLSGILYRGSCGTSATSVAECPYLCGLLGGTVISRQCFHQDLTNKTVTGQLGLLTCEKCLPPCRNSGLPSCTNSLLNEVTSLAGELPTKVVALVGSLEGQLPANLLPTSLVNSVLAQLPTSALPSLLSLISAQNSGVSIPPTASPIAAALPTIVAAPAIINSVAALIPTSVAAPVANMVAAQLPATTIIPPTVTIPIAVNSIAAQLSTTAAAAPMAVPPQGLYPPVRAERDLMGGVEERDLTNVIIEGSSPTRLQLTCGNTTEAVADCPFLCSPMDGETQYFRRCAAVDITNNFIGVNRVTCERC